MKEEGGSGCFTMKEEGESGCFTMKEGGESGCFTISPGHIGMNPYIGYIWVFISDIVNRRTWD